MANQCHHRYCYIRRRGSPLPGANVAIKGTTAGATTTTDDLYSRTIDALLPIATAITTGFANLTGNTAGIQNKSVELGLGANII